MNIVIPAFQPDNRVLMLIHEIQESSDFVIILVNDGSAPKCSPIFESAKQAGCIVLSHEANQGKGAALKTAFRYLLDSGSKDGFICADCDGQHTWKDIKRLAEAAMVHPSSIILGCRKFIGKVPMKSMLGNKITRTVFSLITGNKISDTQTGLRGYSSFMLPWLIQLKGNRYEYEMNQLLEAKEAGYGFCCIPIETIYENNNKGSHFNPVKDSIRIYLPILKFSCSSLICGILDFGLLFLLNKVTDNLLLSVVGARIVSSLTNYVLNRNLVFNAEKGRKATTLIQYYLLVAVIMGCNYLLMYLFSETIGLSLLTSKILTECLLFAFSYTVQHKIIFRDKTENN
jgi:putative flippase GtrA